jgi:hypothetical protein
MINYDIIQWIEIRYGVTLEEAFKSAKILATEKDCWVKFKFNDIIMTMTKGADISDQVRYYSEILGPNKCKQR